MPIPPRSRTYLLATEVKSLKEMFRMMSMYIVYGYVPIPILLCMY